MKTTDLTEDLTQALSTVKANDALDLCIVLDVTASMGKWMTRAQKTIKNIVDNVMKSVFAKEGLYIRIGFVGYRDFGDQNHGGHFKIKDFTENI